MKMKFDKNMSKPSPESRYQYLPDSCPRHYFIQPYLANETWRCKICGTEISNGEKMILEHLIIGEGE